MECKRQAGRGCNPCDIDAVPVDHFKCTVTVAIVIVSVAHE